MNPMPAFANREIVVASAVAMVDLPPLNGTTSRERIWGRDAAPGASRRGWLREGQNPN
jgi:hypothetical protein